jgi:hypothetical protein
MEKRKLPMKIKSPLRRFASLALAGLGVALVSGCGPASALLHDPRALPCLRPDCQIRYEPGAQAYAQAVEKILPRAAAKIETIQGRPFGDPFIVVAYADENAYAAANGRGSARPSGVAFMDRVTLSPRLFRDDPGQLEAYLTHELSHAHLLSHMSSLDLIHIPVWFTEGLAVMASDGGGAQKITVSEAKRAIRNGMALDTPDSTGLLGDISLRFVKGFHDDDPTRQAHMAYRQAGMFVAWLRDRDPDAFAALLADLCQRRSFAEAFRDHYHSGVEPLRREFAAVL